MEFSFRAINDLSSNKTIIDFITSLNTLYLNGEVIVQQFAFSSTKEVNTDKRFELLIKQLLASETFKQAIPDMDEISVDKVKFKQTLLENNVEKYILQFAQHIHWAGAYTSINIREAEKLVINFLNEVCKEHKSECIYVELNHEWSTWFYDIAWDYAICILNNKLNILTIICATDTD